MKSSIISVVLLIASVIIAPSIQTDIPECIQKHINDTLPETEWNLPDSISKYLYRGQTMYLFGTKCCDRFNPLYDESCKYICAPSGGFMGQGDGKCKDFNEMATFLGTIWKDTRSNEK
jgi:hypothetical protein